VAFLGEITAAELDAARSAPPIPVGAFELTLDAVGVWPESRILWLAPSAPPEALFELEGGLWDALATRGFRGEERVYRPHVTLVRRAKPIETSVELAVEPVRFAVVDLALVESFPAGRRAHYEVLQRWPL
jgi:2'-5' RNA ligase